MLNVQVQLGGILPSLPRVSKQNTYILITVTGSWLVFLRLYGLEEERRLVVGIFFFFSGGRNGRVAVVSMLKVEDMPSRAEERRM